MSNYTFWLNEYLAPYVPMFSGSGMGITFAVFTTFACILDLKPWKHI